ncbi:MAG TPA: DNA-3-methyladenine glycosylase [Cyclobacteriaceae bacterium]|nr:DNA-3-methyladenine glycosylase [Cyclobacteriaceae bacterium]HMV11206.1 DNA-3-methyladenine glycosylase [Cyclobacteriaceae bacterium]HMV90254.1 DNA-3-methyladenine glycosylase [Cyclobacteriaceae bacterium]HMX02703.1 DNA-3-methyladenine glycosylase [Cyclobacteriaceae bacterium]HMX51574.1 DNA-3-methyladenine glycosylase [Cyclobacteriaceae bacterium]
MKLPAVFFEQKNVVKIARELLGKGLFTKIDGVVTGGMIVETEAYSWKEKGCHAFEGKKTARNEIMFSHGGFVYVYLCYGMHHLFNVVTNSKGIAEAVLVRALEPVAGLDEMKLRRGELKNLHHLTSGPGKLTKALGIDRTFNGKYLRDTEVWIEDLGIIVKNKDILVSKRIGIYYAGEDANLPWRFTIKDNKWVSK